MYTWNKLKDRALPTWADLKEAIKSADNPDPDSRDIRKLMACLKALTVADPRISGHLLTRNTAILSFGWFVDADNPDDKDECDLAIRRCTDLFETILKFAGSTETFGSFACQLDFTEKHKELRTLPKILRIYDPTEIEVVDNLHINILDGESSELKRIHKLALNDLPDDFICDTDNEFARGGLLRKLLARGVMSEDMVLEWANFNRLLKGIIHGILKRQATAEDRKAAEKQLVEIIYNNFTVSGDSVEFKFQSVTDPKGSQSLEGLIKRFDSDKSICLLGQANTSELPASSGSRAALQIQKMITADIIYSMIIAREKLCNRLLLLDYRQNFDKTATEAPWKFKINLPEEIDLESRAAVLSQVKDLGMPVKTKEAYNFLNLEQPDNLPETLFGGANSEDEPFINLEENEENAD